ncbi:phage portal protein [Paenibacillus sp. AK121]|uniref:phage tail assembly chaperone n=1 Tax=Paenibacillus TaxID=44249 RepID=UPI001C24AE31|nr:MULTISPECIES: phage portal protein [unclassified Paenibacillus]MBU9707136.1 phage portal protein [Paenibacillus sp. AK121]MEE4566362.1 phage portal protein [Paenibacillus polymyxa]
MSDLTLFYAQNVDSEITEDVAISPRFKDKEGKPVKWVIRSIPETENSVLRKESTKKVKGKNGIYSNEFDSEAYLSKMVVAAVVYPNLKDAELQKSYGVLGAESLIKKMLLSGEYSTLLDKVQSLSGYDRDMNELVDEVKNS